MEARERPTRSRLLAYAAATGLAYAVLAQLVASLTALGNSTGATFWPGAGLTLGVLLARPRREWPLHLGAVFLAETLIDVKLGYGWGLGLQWAAVNTLEPFIGAALLTWGGRRAPDIAQRQDLGRLIGFGVMAAIASRKPRVRRSVEHVSMATTRSSSTRKPVLLIHHDPSGCT